MTRERFQALAEAYGGDIDRWPECDRAAAHAFAATEPALAGETLAPEWRLDAALSAFVVEPAPSLRDAILAAAPRARAVAKTLRWAVAAALGIGLTASAAAGVAAGFALAPPSAVRAIGVHAADPRSVASLGDVSALADPTGDAANG